MRLSRKQFETLIDQALRDIPPAFEPHLRDIAIEVEPWPDEETCRDLGIDDPSELMGLYHGTPLTQRSLDDAGWMPDRIVLYQGGIEAAADTPDEIADEIRTTVLHEIGHHFGLEEDDLEALGYD